ncbi:MAG: hypothetical protein OEV44_10890, partial [Spirochaetota bacterium]|nr:hypothetical protein [Spirochaetota bacterium]
MKKIITFSDAENNVINQIRSALKVLSKDKEISLIESNVISLDELSKSISLYPSILGEQHLGSFSRSVGTLIEALCAEDLVDIIFRVPTKSILGKSFSIAKVNFFFMLLYLSRENSIKEIDGKNDIQLQITDIITNNVFTIMAEEVFISIISDESISLHMRSKAAFLLANIWEYRMDHGVKEFTPILNNLWVARKNLKPVYGTMLGVSELLLISQNSYPVWLEYLQHENIMEEEIKSIQEFLMGLSFEEMYRLSKELDKTGKTLLCEDDIINILGKEISLPIGKDFDPREFYKSFSLRTKNAYIRMQTGLEGPKKTMEEYLMSCLLS